MELLLKDLNKELLYRCGDLLKDLNKELLEEVLRRSFRRFGKVLESLGRFRKVWEGLGRFGKV